MDGDVKKQDVGWKNYPKNKNITFLPTDMAPERMVYEMLFNFNEEDLFWDNSMSGFSKAVCFRDYPNYLENIDDIKCWFERQKGNAGRGYSKFLSEWKKRNTKEVEQFICEFIEKYNYVARQTGFAEIDYDE